MELPSEGDSDSEESEWDNGDFHEEITTVKRRGRKHMKENENEVKHPIKEGNKFDPQERLLRAIKKNDFQTFTEMLQRPDVEPNFKYGKPYYTTCIELASRLPERGNFVKLLLDSGAKPNVHEIHLEPIHYAAREGNPEALEALLQHKKIKINTADSFGRTALHHAVRYSETGRDDKYAQCITLLLKCPELDINKPNIHGYTAIHEAANSRKEGVRLILKHRNKDIDLDTHRARGRTARECILIKHPELKNQLPEGKERYLSLDCHSQLLKSLQRCQLETFRDILRQVDDSGNARVDPNYIYDKPHKTTCLELACQKENYEEFVTELLNAGADPNLTTKEKPLHLAAELGNYKVLSVLLEDRRTNVNAVNGDGKSVMHLITEHDENMEETTMKCLKIVLNNPRISINTRDKNGHHPIFAAIQRNRKSIIETILVTAGNRLDIDHVEHPYTVTLREVVFQMYPELQNIVSLYSDHTTSCESTKLFQLLYDRKLEDFKENFRTCNKKTNVTDYTDGNYTFLQYATLYGLNDIIKVLLESGVNPNSTTDYEKRPPIVIACMKKNAEILKLFFESDKNKTLNINSADAKGNTALHFASKNEDLKSVLDLMKHGANVKHKNIFNKPPLSAKSVEYFLDISLETNNKFPDDENYELIFNYNFLVAYTKQRTKRSFSLTVETPLISNVEVGNQNVNYVSLNAEMDFLYYLCRSDDHRDLMKHPLISSFLHLKWQRVRLLFFLNLFIYLLYVIIFNFYILSKVSKDGNNMQDLPSVCPENAACILIGLFQIYFIVREIIQFSLSFKMYYKNLENVLDIALILIAIYVLLSSEWSTAFIVLGILLSWTELIVMTGHHPKLSRNIEMLKSVSLNYCWFLFSYMFLIIAFAFSFYSLLHTNVGNSPDRNYTREYDTSKDTEEENNFFVNPWLSILKIFIMMMGEFEASTFLPQMASFGTFFWLFSLFVFIIAMVLLNLLTGLAVSDTNAIKDHADELSLRSHIRLIYEIERIRLHWDRFVYDNCKYKILRPLLKLHKLILFRKVSIFPNSMVSTICVFPNKGPNIIYKNSQHNSSSKMDLAILENAMNIISKRNAETEINNISRRLNYLQEKVKENSKRLYSFQERMEIKLAEIHEKLEDCSVQADDMQEIKKKVEASRKSAINVDERLKSIETSVNVIKNMLSDVQKY